MESKNLIGPSVLLTSIARNMELSAFQRVISMCLMDSVVDQKVYVHVQNFNGIEYHCKDFAISLIINFNFRIRRHEIQDKVINS